MDIILSKAKVNLPQLRRAIERLAAKDLSALSEPCYYPRTKKFYFELLNLMNLKDKDFKEFVKRSYKGSKAQKWLFYQDKATNLLILIMHLFLKKRNKAGFHSIVLYHIIVQYSRLMHKQLKYCNPDIFRQTLEGLTKTHLFAREKTISNALYYLSREVHANRKYAEGILEWDIDKIVEFQVVSRTRVSQSIKSFVENYYKVKEKGDIVKTYEEPTGDEEDYRPEVKIGQRGKKSIDEIVKKFVVYKLIDKKALEESKKISKIKTSIATIITQKLINKKYTDNIRMILQLFVKGLPDVSSICGNKFYPYIKKLMAVKRTRANVYFKQQVNILLIKVLEDAGHKDVYDSYTTQTQFIINTFLAYYLTIVLRNNLC
jgi:hypothetical protein